MLTPSQETDQLHQQLLKGELPPARRNPATGATSQAGGSCPYRGLSAFQEADAPFYFGREAFVDTLEQAIRNKKMVAVIVGSSGSGKSSVLYAGLLPRLRQAGGYQFASFRPAASPSMPWRARCCRCSSRI